MKNGELVKELKGVWENDHAEDVTKAYNKIVKVLSKLDIYSANMVVNLVHLQTIHKSIMCTVGADKKEEEEVIEDGGMEGSSSEGREHC